MSKSSEFHCQNVAQAFVETQPLTDFGTTETVPYTEPQVPYAIMSVAQEEKLDNLIYKLQQVETYKTVYKPNEEQMAQKEKEYFELQAKLEDYKKKSHIIAQTFMEL